MKKVFGFILCAIAVILPWRARIIFSELLGWLAQLFYFSYYFLVKVILSNLSSKESENLK